MRRTYFRGLNGVRFFAALAVLVHHIEQFKFDAGLPNLYVTPWVGGLGDSAVSLFFVLSGFLITNLLLEEYAATGRSSISRFYVRRCLRIWPLYFLIVAFSFVALPHLQDLSSYSGDLAPHYWEKLLLFLVFLPNVALAAFSPVLGASQLWSIGVEEQFYLAWPIVLRKFRRSLPWVLLTIILAKFGLVLVLSAFGPVVIHVIPPRLWGIIVDVVERARFENMACGALAAYYMSHGKLRTVRQLFHPLARLAVLALMILMVGYRPFFWHDLLEATAYTLFIIQIVGDDRAWRFLDNRLVSYLGTISYGIYMFHPSLIAIVLSRLMPISDLALPFNILLYGFGVSSCLAVAALSSRIFERRFLRLGQRFPRRAAAPAEGPNPAGVLGPVRPQVELVQS